MHNENQCDIRALSDEERRREREMDEEFGRQIMADRAKYAQIEKDILQEEKQKTLAARRLAYAHFQTRLDGTIIALRSILTGATKWRDDLKFLDCPKLVEVQSLLKQLEKLTAPVAATFSDKLPIYLPVRTDRGIPAGYHDDPETGKWKLDGY